MNPLNYSTSKPVETPQMSLNTQRSDHICRVIIELGINGLDKKFINRICELASNTLTPIFNEPKPVLFIKKNVSCGIDQSFWIFSEDRTIDIFVNSPRKYPKDEKITGSTKKFSEAIKISFTRPRFDNENTHNTVIEKVAKLKPKDPTQLDTVYREIQLLDNFKNADGIVQIDKAALYTKTCEKVWKKDFVIFQKLYTNDLGNFILGCEQQNGGEIPINIQCSLILSILQGMMLIHNKGYVHGDIKPENILIDKSVVNGREFPVGRIIDFDTTYIQGTKSNKVLGTFPYYAPECWDRILKHCADCPGPEIDIWALGCIFHRLFYGQWPVIYLLFEYMEPIWRLKNMKKSQEHEFLNAPHTLQKQFHQMHDENNQKFVQACEQIKTHLVMMQNTEAPSRQFVIPHLIWSLLRPNPLERISAIDAWKKLSAFVST
jgi:serine/threonine protein kinase